MKAALIPPTPALFRYGRADFHLLLSHLMDDPTYSSWYFAERQLGAYLVLDNSAHEFQKGLAPKTLRDQAWFLQAQEVVVPDALFDGSKTVDLALETLEMWYESPHDSRMTRLNPALMYVPQGKDELEYVACTRELVRMHLFMAKRHKEFRAPFVLGISKDYDEQFNGGLYALLRDFIAPMKEVLWEGRRIKMHVHMLGWMRNLFELNRIAKDFPWLRSTDSAKPFVYALDGVSLHKRREVPEYPKRPKDYFNLTLSRAEMARATRNCSVFRLCAEGMY